MCEKSYGRRVIFLAMLATFGCFASNDKNMPWIKGKTNKAPLEYKVGETMVFSLAVQNAEYLPQGLQIVWRRTGDDGKSEEGKAPLSSAKPLTVRTSLCRPGFVRIFAEVCDRNGKPWMLEAQGGIRKGIFFDGGAAAEPRRLCQSKPEPKDFDAFWRKRVAELAAVPMKAETEEIVSPTKGVKLYKLTVTCAGARPATGYLSVPDKPGKYPAWIGFHGYGASWAKGATEPPRKLTADAVRLSLSAHGFELGRDDAYYKRFRQSVCRNGYGHAFDPAENAKPETCYFGGMSWRVMRGIEYLKTRPEWNGRDLTVAGGSQGALQAIWGAALVPGVTKVQIEIPWCCDIGGTEDGRNHGDWFIRWMPGLDYYDPVNMARRIPLSCKVRIARAGLGDYIAPPCGVAMFYNNLRCPKSVVWVQGSQHCNEPPVRDAFEWSDDPPNTSPVSQTADFTIVSNCLPTACIVVNMDAPPGIRYAAEELARWTKELTGATLPVVPVPVKGLKPITFRQGAAEVTGDGFMLTALADRAEIAAGCAEQGILFGIYYILNRYGGIYWCHPESGADMPVGKRDFSLPEGVLVKNPMPFRQGVPSGDGPLATATVREMCARWNVRNGFPLCQTLIGADPAKIEPGNLYPNGLIRELGSDGTVRGGGHCLGRLLLETEVDAGELAREVEWTREHAGELFVNGAEPCPCDVYARWRVLARHHQEWFGLVNGKRLPASVDLGGKTKEGSSNPCLSNPEVRERMLANFKAWRAKYPPNARVEWQMLCDDNGQWCECDRCMKLLKAKGRNWDPDRGSDYWWDFINWFSERVLKDPSVTLIVFAYNIYREPPTRVKPIARDRMVMSICPQERCYIHAIADHSCPRNGRFLDVMKKWKAFGLPIMTFEYMNQTPGACNYLFWERTWIDDLRWYWANGISHGAGGLVGPWASYSHQDNYFRRNAARARWVLSWLTGYFEWDPDADFESVRNGLFDAYYRVASVEMTSYHLLLEKALYDTGRCMPYGSDSQMVRQAATGTVIAEAEALLARAEAKAAVDPVLRKRIDDERGWFETNWKATGLSADMPARHRIVRASQGDAFAHSEILADFRRLCYGDTTGRSKLKFEAPTDVCFAHDGANLLFRIRCVDTVETGGTNYAVRVLLTPPGFSRNTLIVSMYRDGRHFVEWQEFRPGEKVQAPKPQVRFSDELTPLGWIATGSIPLKRLGGAASGAKLKLDVERYRDGRIDYRSGSLSGMMSAGRRCSLPEYTDVFELE